MASEKDGTWSALIAAIVIAGITPAIAETTRVNSPEDGVLCDKYMCVDASGISKTLTEKFLGGATAIRLFSQGDFNQKQFTFMNGVFCDTQERVCHADRYFDVNGQRSAIDVRTTDILFGD